jgi:hypothetical protein
MWEIMKFKGGNQSLNRELSYASHHHLIPLYVLSGVAIAAIAVLGCFLAVLWQIQDNDKYLPQANTLVRNIESSYLPATIVPSEKKQYIYASNVRFATGDPYHGIRYAYDPGNSSNAAAGTLTVSTSGTLQELEQPLLRDPGKITDYAPRLQNCAKLYIVRFVPGATPEGGFAPLRDVRLQDGRTAYIHKNANCVPGSTRAMDTIDQVEKVILSIESY